MRVMYCLSISISHLLLSISSKNQVAAGCILGLLSELTTVFLISLHCVPFHPCLIYLTLIEVKYEFNIAMLHISPPPASSSWYWFIGFSQGQCIAKVHIKVFFFSQVTGGKIFSTKTAMNVFAKLSLRHPLAE